MKKRYSFWSKQRLVLRQERKNNGLSSTKLPETLITMRYFQNHFWIPATCESSFQILFFFLWWTFLSFPHILLADSAWSNCENIQDTQETTVWARKNQNWRKNKIWFWFRYRKWNGNCNSTKEVFCRLESWSNDPKTEPSFAFTYSANAEKKFRCVAKILLKI